MWALTPFRTPIAAATRLDEPICSGEIRRKPDYRLFDYALAALALASSLVALPVTVRAPESRDNATPPSV